jgi:outer membrane protein assembly factor BamB
VTDADPKVALESRRLGSTLAQPHPRASRKWRRLGLLFAAIALPLWGLWLSGAISNRHVPLPSTRVEATIGTEGWALPGRDAAHSSAMPINSRVQGDILWRFETNSTLGSAPAVAQGKVFLTTGDKRLFALDERTGALVWERNLPALTSASPTLTDDLVYLTLRDGQVIALDVMNGAIRWTFQSPNLFSASAVIHRGVVYAASWGGTVHALDAVSGLELWTFQTEGRIVAPLAFAENLMAVAIDDGLVHIIDTVDAGKRLTYSTGFIVLESPVFTHDRVLVSTAKGRIAAIDPSKIEYPFERGLRYWRQQLFIWGLQPHPPIPKGHVWGRKLAGNVELSSPAVANGVAFVASADGQVHALNVTDGDSLWTYDAGVRIQTFTTVAGNRVYVGTDDGDVLVLDVTDGSVEQRIHLGTPLRGSVVVTDGALYVTSQEPGMLFAVR